MLSLVASGALCLVPWAVRNWPLFGELVWMSTNLGAHNAPDFQISWLRLVELRRSGLSEALRSAMPGG